MANRLGIESCDRLGIASIMTRRDVPPDAIAARLGVVLPDRPAALASGGRTVVGTGPGTWLLLEAEAAPDFAETVQETLAGLAAVSDQSSGYSVSLLSGPCARALLQRGLAIDLHPDRFRTGSTASSVIAHIGVIVWQADEQPCYYVATFRSFAASFRHWLNETAAAL